MVGCHSNSSWGFLTQAKKKKKKSNHHHGSAFSDSAVGAHADGIVSLVKRVCPFTHTSVGPENSQHLIKGIHQVTSSLLPNISPLWLNLQKTHFLTSVSLLTYLLAKVTTFYASIVDTLTDDLIETQFYKYEFLQSNFGYATNSTDSHAWPLPGKIHQPPMLTSSLGHCPSFTHPIQI